MKRIPLTQGQFALVDDEDFEWLSQWKWHARWSPLTKSFYASRAETIDGKQRTVQMHREILGLKRGDKRQGDHINHNTLDNRRSQIRIATQQQNKWNRKNAKGYTWHKRDCQYAAQIKVNGKHISLGYFDTPTEARRAYIKAKQKYHRI